MLYLKYFCILIAIVNFNLINSEDVCGDGWDIFHDDYYDTCYRYYPDILDDYMTVVKFCQTQQDSSLPTINSQTEQEFLNKLIVKYKMVENVWLDASVKNKHIVWADSTSADYENWLPGRPVNDSNCVEMSTNESSLGKWEDRPCTKKNAYVCKRVVMWSGQRSERLFIDNMRKIAQLEQNQKQDHAGLAQLEESQVPVGFIYVQMPGQTEPTSMWPKYTWSDVTKTYAGQFFRAEGGGSLAFDKGVQPENAPRLAKVHRSQNVNWDENIDITPGAWSKTIYSGADGGNAWFLNFYSTSGEVRPVNQAVRIFKRTK